VRNSTGDSAGALAASPVGWGARLVNGTSPDVLGLSHHATDTWFCVK
jgi:hypothetical protein